MYPRYIHFGSIVIDRETSTVWQDGGVVLGRNGKRLKPLAVRILIFLIEKSPQVIRGEDVKHLLEYSSDARRTGDLTRYISYLRSSIRKKPFDEFVRTIGKKRGNSKECGYSFIWEANFSHSPEPIARPVENATIRQPLPQPQQSPHSHKQPSELHSSLLTPVRRLPVGAKLFRKPSVQLVDRVSRAAIRRPGSTRTLKSVDVNEATKAIDSGQRLDGFTFVLDGFIANMAAELIFRDEQTSPIRGQCPLLYEYCLRDLTFALVYGSYVVTSADFRPSLTRPDQPGKELFARLGEICKQQELDPDLRDGALLSKKRAEIRTDIQHLGRCIADPQLIPLFREYMKREAQKHLGEDPSLFKEGLDPERYKFDVKREYYKDRILQNVLPKQATDLMVSFLPENLESGDVYARDARVQFVTQNALSLITIMWEYDVSAERRGLCRMPHILRSLVKQKSGDRSLTQHQEQLQELVVRNALYPALLHTERRKRHLIVSRIVDLRDDPDFRRVREVLQREHLLLMEPSLAKEKQAQRLLRHIKGLTHSAHTDIFLFQRRSALRKLYSIHAPEFEKQLHRVFPELRPSIGN
jgi:DNA-binding winged helix-turn-helix (wHTH) protein